MRCSLDSSTLVVSRRPDTFDRTWYTGFEMGFSCLLEPQRFLHGSTRPLDAVHGLPMVAFWPLDARGLSPARRVRQHVVYGLPMVAFGPSMLAVSRRLERVQYSVVHGLPMKFSCLLEPQRVLHGSTRRLNVVHGLPMEFSCPSTTSRNAAGKTSSFIPTLTGGGQTKEATDQRLSGGRCRT